MRSFCYLLIGFLSLGACRTASFKGSANQGQTLPPPKDVVTPPVPPTRDEKPQDPEAPLFTECAATPERKLVAGVYLLPKDTAKLPDLKTVTKLKDVCLKQLDVTDRDFLGGFPGVSDLVEWFALDINFRVDIPESGDYKFTLNSDDGSLLEIDGKPVIDNDGLHEQKEVSGNATLTKGWHDFKVKYYEGPRYRIALELFWQKPGATAREYIPETQFARPVR